MGQLDYSLDVTWEPQQLRAGQAATITVKVNNLSGEVTSMHLAVPSEGFYETFRRTGENRFTLTGQVPWEAYGVYSVHFYGRDAQGNKGPETVVDIRIA